jgi:lysophospholipase L1-like esterase
MLAFFAALPGKGATFNPAKYEKDIRAFEASDQTNPPPANAVLFLGSSSIRYWTNLAESFPELKTIRRGFGGSTIPDSTAFAHRIVIPYRPSKIVLYAGDNDIADGYSPEQVLSEFQKFVGQVGAALPETEIYFIAIKPSPSRWRLAAQQEEANRLVRDYCARERKLQYIDVWTPMLDEERKPDRAFFTSDNLHINEKGYRLWAKIISAALDKKQ